jgi:hypothetical protein
MERGRRKLVRKRYTPDSEDEDVLSVDSQDSGPAIRYAFIFFVIIWKLLKKKIFFVERIKGRKVRELQ